MHRKWNKSDSEIQRCSGISRLLFVLRVERSKKEKLQGRWYVWHVTFVPFTVSLSPVYDISVTDMSSIFTYQRGVY